MLIEFSKNMRTEEEFARAAVAASKTCENLGIPLSGSGTRRKKSRPAALQDCVMDLATGHLKQLAQATLRKD